MAIGLPITAVQASGTLGKTVTVTTNGTTNVASSLTMTAARRASAILITNGGTHQGAGNPGTGVVAFARVSSETTPTATAADLPVQPGDSIIVQNPVPGGVVGLAVISTGTTNVDMYFTPIEGGF